MGMTFYVETEDCRENGLRWMRAYAMGDRWRYRALDGFGRVLAEGELGEAADITDGWIRFRVELLPFRGELVKILCDSAMLRESVEHVMDPPRWGDDYSHQTLYVTAWLEAEPSDPNDLIVARTGDNRLVPYEPDSMGT